MLRTPALILVALLCWAPESAAQRLPLRHFTIGDGLAHNVVVALHEDALGYIWVGTLEGTSRFDGVTFASHGRREGLPAPLVTAFGEGTDGRIWLATSPLGLFEFDDARAAQSSENGATEAVFRRVPISQERRTNANRVYSVAVDGETLWAGTDDGLYRGSTQPGVGFAKVLPASDSEDGAPAFRASNGVLWMGIGNRLVSLSAGGQVTIELPSARPQPNDIVGIAEDDSRRLTVAGLRGLYRHSGKDRFEPVPLELLPGETLLSLASAPGGFWIGTSHALLRLVDGAVQRYDETQGISAPVLALLRRGDALWIGSTDGLRVMTHERSTGFLPPGRAKPVLRAIAIDRTQAVAATAAAIFATGDLRQSESVAGARIARGPAATWWIGTDEGIFVSGSSGSVPSVHSARRLGAAEGLHPGSLLFHDVSQPSSGMHLDASGRMWLATADDRLYRCASDSRTHCEQLPHDGISWRNRPVNLTDDRNGTLWIASVSGLARLRDGRTDVIHLRDPAVGRLELSPAVAVDPRGWLWVGTHHEGVAVSREPLAAKPSFEFVTTAAGLSSDAVYAIAETSSRVFLATGRGLDVVDAARAPLHAEPVDVGFETGVVQDLSAAGDGLLWIAAAAGVFRLETTAKPTTPVPLRTYIRRLFIGGAAWPLPERGAAQIGPLVLRPGDDDVRVEFTAPRAADRQQRYHYRLDPGSGSWSRPQTERTLTLARLQPASYTLQLRAVQDGADSVPAVVRFEVLAPVWQRWWFRALGVLVMLAAALGVQRARMRRTLALERVRRQIAADLHDDVGSRLAEIAVVGELGMRDANGRDHERFGQIAATARDVRQAMSDVVWAIDPRRDQVGDLAARIRSAAEALLDPDVEVSLAAPPADAEVRLPLGPHERRQLLLIAREALVNIEKHARATRVEIAYTVDRSTLALSIVDNGIGIGVAPNAGGHGLTSMQERAGALRGTVTIGPRPEGGTRVLARIPLSRSARRHTPV